MQPLHLIFGFEPDAGFHKRVEAQVNNAIQQWKEKKKVA